MNYQAIANYGRPAPPTRDELISPALTFQGLIVETQQFGKLPWFEPCLPWLTPSDRQRAYAAKRISGVIRSDGVNDTHAILGIPNGSPLYDEPDTAYSPDRFGALDWTSGGTRVDPQFFDLLREIIGAGFPKVLLYLGGDGPGGWPISYKQLDLLRANEEFRTTLYKYCAVVPGWDSVFYGWPPEEIVKFGAYFRSLFPDGVLALHYGTGHIPVGEGGGDYQPRGAGQDPTVNPGRMADYDLLIGEFGGTEASDIHQDSTWQILNRLEQNYVRPSDQPAGDDVDRRYYLTSPNPRGRFGHFAMEFDEYAAVRCGQDFDGMAARARANRLYMRSMGVACVG